MTPFVLPADLTDALKRGSLALFWGGDLPQALTGVPSRRDLAEALATRTNYRGVDRSLEAVAQAQVARQSGFVNELNSFIVRMLADQSRQPQPIHRLAAELPVRHYIVTAYDALLEDALRQGGRPYNAPVVTNASVGNLSFLDSNLPTPVWLYGWTRAPHSLVATHDGHLRLLHDHTNADLLDWVRGVLRFNTLLFIGYDMTDPDFEFLYTQMLTSAGPLARRAFAVQPAFDDDQRLTWQQRNVELIEADPATVLRALLGSPALDRPILTPVAPVAPHADATSESADATKVRPDAFTGADPLSGEKPMPSLPSAPTLRRLLLKLTEEDIDVILLEPEFVNVRGGSGPTLHSRIMKLMEVADKQMRIPRLLELIYDANPAGYLQIMPEPPPGRDKPPVQPPPVQPPPVRPPPVRAITYHNFELRIRRGGASGQYEVETNSDLGGQATGSVTFDVNAVDFSRMLARFGLLRGAEPEERTGAPADSGQPAAGQELAELGHRLYQAAFPPPVERCLFTARGKLDENDSLRLRLRLEAPELAVLPWELLTDTAPGPGIAPEFLTLNLKFSLVRFPPVGRPVGSVTLPKPLRILLAVAAPTDQRQLRTAVEIAQVRRALQPLGSQVEVQEMEHVMAVDLLPRLRETFHVLHFIGHGLFDPIANAGQLILEDENHRSDPLDARMLGQLLAGSTIRLVFLNACETAQTASNLDAYGIADTLVKAGVPAVTAMQTAVRDDYAVLFAEHFYRGLTQGLMLDDCVGEGRRAVYLRAGLQQRAGQQKFDWAVPVLTTRVSDGRLFEG